VYSHWQNHKSRFNEIGMMGRLSSLSQEELDGTREMILRAFNEKRPLTLPEIGASIRAMFNKVLLLHTLCHALVRQPRVRSCQAHSMDEKRVDVTDDAIRDSFGVLFATLSEAPEHFIFNLDEIGHQRWADAKGTICFVPSEFAEPGVCYPLSRIGKRVTLNGCIATDGSFICPRLIISWKMLRAKY
jgi:hypothetical protein